MVTKTLLTQNVLHQMSAILVKLDDSDGLDSNMEQNSLTEALHHVRDNKFDVVSMSSVESVRRITFNTMSVSFIEICRRSCFG